MNGMHSNQFGDFKSNWNFVTVRYRKDTSEMRFVYANDIAWQALKNNVIDYPNGAAFAKIAVATIDDPIFPSSAIPGGQRRVQYMLRDATKYKDTQGWGYAIFDWSGKTFPGDSKTVTVGCAGCHQIAKDRGYVFAGLLGDNFINKVDFESWKYSNKFIQIFRNRLPNDIRKFVPSKYRNVSLLQGILANSAFFGTLDEVTPMLSEHLIKFKIPAILMAHDQKQFSLVLESKNVICPAGEIGLISIHTVPNGKKPILEKQFCERNFK
jgi:hypothetical protein